MVDGPNQQAPGRPVWQYGLSSFQFRGTKFDRFLTKNHHTPWKHLYFVNKHSITLSKIKNYFRNSSVF